MYIKYEIPDTAIFDNASYIHVISELTTLVNGIAHIDSDYKSAIVISYLKDHSIRMEWLTGNNKLTKAITSRSHNTAHIEALFEGCRNNKAFLNDFEAYIKMRIETKLA